MLRAVLGSPTLNYLGFSYGTYLGTWYAELFPQRVGRVVLDGALDPSLSTRALDREQARGFTSQVQAFIRSCLKTPRCPLRGSPAQAQKQLIQLARRVDGKPLPTRSRRPLTRSLLETGLAATMYSPQGWPYATQGLRAALKGDGTILLALADFYYQRDARGSYSNQADANTAVNCLDHAETRTIAQIDADGRALAAAYPLLEGNGWSGLHCTQWPYRAVVPTREVQARGAAPILVVGTTGDPATPYSWAKGLAAQLASGVLLTRRGNGHTAYTSGNRCIATAVDAFLLQGTPPAKGTICS